MTPQSALEQLLSELNADGIRIVSKRGWFWTALHYLVIVVTLGGNRKFMSYYTTLAATIATPPDWETRSAASRYAVLMHERDHVHQARWLGFGNAWVGMPMFALLYLLLPLPFGLAYFRYRFERTAYATGIRAKLRWHPEQRTDLIDSATMQLTSGRYGWTAALWPGKRRVREWFENAV